VILLLGLPVLSDDVVVAPAPVVLPGPMPKILDVALPVNPTVVGGAATVAFTPDTMTVTPSTNRTWIQYDSFDVGKNATVRFQQGPANLTINEVTGSKMSEIAGRIHVTDGAIVLMNRNGQIFKDGAILDGNIMVSTVPLNQQAFMNSGKLLFQSAGLLGQKPRVTVGSVKASGLSVFIAPWFESLGLFTGNLHVFSGESVSLSLCGNTLARFEVQGALKDSLLHVVEGSEIEGQQVVLHTGHMEDVIDSAIKVDGSLKAQDIMVVGNEITLSETSSLDVSGNTGGTIRLGVDQDYDLQDPKRFDHVLAQNITIKEGAKLLAPGEDQGGTIYTFAKNKGDYKGTYDISSAKGPGGLLELSVKKNLMLPDILNLKASGGEGQKAGTLLLDPETVNIINGINDGQLDGGTVRDGTINNALRAANVIITATTSITGANDSTIQWTTPNTLTLSAPIIAMGGNVVMDNTGGNATLNFLASTGFTITGGVTKMQRNTVNITSPALITGNAGLIDQKTPGDPTKIRVTGPGFSTTTDVVRIDVGSRARNIRSSDYTLVTTGAQTPANVPAQVSALINSLLGLTKPYDDQNISSLQALGQLAAAGGAAYVEELEQLFANAGHVDAAGNIALGAGFGFSEVSDFGAARKAYLDAAKYYRKVGLYEAAGDAHMMAGDYLSALEDYGEMISSDDAATTSLGMELYAPVVRVLVEGTPDQHVAYADQQEEIINNPQSSAQQRKSARSLAQTAYGNAVTVTQNIIEGYLKFVQATSSAALKRAFIGKAEAYDIQLQDYTNKVAFYKGLNRS